MSEACRFCGAGVLPAEAVTVHSYWQGLPLVSHRVCRDAGVKSEAFDCQVIDADCNDCKHFKRGKLVEELKSAMADGKAAMVLFNTETFTGHCLKFDRPTLAFPNKWTGRECFEHRRAI